MPATKGKSPAALYVDDLQPFDPADFLEALFPDDLLDE